MLNESKKRAMSFIQLLETPESRELIDQIEWGCSDAELLQSWKDELLEKFGWDWDANC